ncbi:MAG: cysteine--tRNA ligase [Nitrospirae bacterium]|nr:cysteine--tRNA ligase [Nitrospirota bacterium]
MPATRGKPLQLFDSMTRMLREFVPVRAGKAGIYSCGPTVYNYAHLGNLRAYLFTDTLRRVLLFKGYAVTQVMNITDVGHLTSDADAGEDKMEKAAAQQHRSVWDIARHYTDAFLADMAALNILPPDHQPKATDHIQGMIDFNRKLEAAGHTYLLPDGLYFDTSTVPDYGRLGRLDIEGQKAGARVADTHGKRNPTDFCLWRKSPADSRRLMEWDSPWGTGAPGWHLECSEMSLRFLGAPFDIHTGGIDHRQVHHCNEVAQNMGFLGNGDAGVRYWLHNEFLVLGDDKMSKSKGGFLRLQTVLDQGIHPLVYRYFCLQASYRKPLEFGWEGLKGAGAGLKRIHLRVAELAARAGADTATRLRDAVANPLTADVAALSTPLADGARRYLADLDAALSDDLNTPRALAALNTLLADDALAATDALRLAALFELVLGIRLLAMTADDLNLRAKDAALTDDRISALIEERNLARKNRDFARADAIRDELDAGGVLIKDGPQGTTWEWKPA